MNHQTKTVRRRATLPAYREVWERLDQALEENTVPDNTAKIEILGRHMFGYLWDVAALKQPEDAL